MGLFMKKPIVVEARQLTEDTRVEIANWLAEKDAVCAPCPQGLYIQTLEGLMLASWGDFVICGLAGEFYACERDIFEASYAAVETNLGTLTGASV